MELSESMALYPEVFMHLQRLSLEHGTIDQLFEEIVLLYEKTFRLSMVWIAKLDYRQEQPIQWVAGTNEARKFVASLPFTHDATHSISKGPLLKAFRTASSQIVDNVEIFEDYALWQTQLREQKVCSTMYVPIIIEEISQYVICLYQNELAYFTSERVGAIEAITHAFAYTLYHEELLHSRFDKDLDWRLSAKVFESLDAIIVTDARGNILLVNTSFMRFTGYRREEVIGKNPRILQSGRHDAAFYEKMWDQLKREDHWEGEIWNKRKNGEIYPEWLSISALHDANGNVSNYVAHFLDLSQIKKAESEIQQLAFFDPLTGLANRRYFFQMLKSNEMGLQSGEKAILLFIDVDHFKEVNDYFGHAVGDHLLQILASRMEQRLTENGILARLGGDEFVALLRVPCVKTFDRYALDIVESLQNALKAPIIIDDIHIPVTVSIGVRIFEHGKYEWDELMKGADLAMYEAKRKGGDASAVFDPHLIEKIDRLHVMTLALQDAVEDDRIELYIQGQYDAQHQIVGAEILSRWDWGRKSVTPDEFIHLAERKNLILRLDRSMIRRAIFQHRKWREEGYHVPPISVNISTISLRDPSFLASLHHVLERENMKKGELIIEMAENVLVDETHHFVQAIRELQDVGVLFSIHHFGTGISSIRLLAQYHPLQIKLDRNLMQKLLSSTTNQVLTRSLLQVAKAFDVAIVAEGIESKRQYDWLLAQGCTQFQGYYFMKPEPIEDFSLRFSRNSVESR